MKKAVQTILGFAALALASAVQAQATKTVESKEIGVRLTIPKQWDTSCMTSGFCVNCAPTKGENGRHACYISITMYKAQPGQMSITDADRAKWKGWVSAGGMRTILSAEDMKVGGMPAYHIIEREGKRADDTFGSNVFVLVAGEGKMLRVSFNAILKPGDYELYKPGFMKALQTLVPIP